ncbi:hypothetical protein Rsub_12651 [Raphidocelis subcapitata]|uniref:Transcriptional regulator n=1 Tax=Raphidocelis subcapitata TaxID=307507 RepID=A0A2V0PJI6_9CHLO|nr:hypothetical protein Rsub_12651 [Raphidocelis subcapitata]|eukprot:GBF99958.1 hypothetical protein Rsub_12651 [Raphidocelis subcapitata]
MNLQPGAMGAARPWSGGGSRKASHDPLRTVHARRAAAFHGRRRVVASASGSGGGSGDDAPSSSSLPDALPAAGPGTDWRAYRARLAALEAASSGAASGGSESSAPLAAASFDDGRWAHSVPVPETGCILLAHPSMFGVSQTYFRLAAILILECSESGSLGVILNRPTEHHLRDMTFTDEAATRPFGGNRLYMGGDVGQNSIIVVTSAGAVADATEVAAGIRVCTVGAAAAAVRAGKARPEEFRFFAQYSGWGPGQLQRECKAGVWYVASVSSQLALSEKLAAGAELWHEVLATMGGPYAELSQLVQDGEPRLSPGEEGGP